MTPWRTHLKCSWKGGQELENWASRQEAAAQSGAPPAFAFPDSTVLLPGGPRAYLPIEELLDLRNVTFRIRGDVDGLGIKGLHTELNGSHDLLEVGQAHGHGQWCCSAAAVAHTLWRGHEV